MIEEGKFGGGSLQRILTGIVLASIALFGVLSEALFFFSLIWLIIFVSAFEWTSFIGLRNHLFKFIYSASVLGLCVLCFYSARNPELLIAFILIGLVFWFFATIFIYRAALGLSLFGANLSLSGAARCTAYAYLSLSGANLSLYGAA